VEQTFPPERLLAACLFRATSTPNGRHRKARERSGILEKSLMIWYEAYASANQKRTKQAKLHGLHVAQQRVTHFLKDDQD
jgi:hypothetical protein